LTLVSALVRFAAGGGTVTRTLEGVAFWAETRYDKCMMNERTMTVYTSPKTGATYKVLAEEQTRMAGDWYKGESLKPVTYTVYNIYDGDAIVQFALSEAGIAESVAHYEGEIDGWYCLPRD
jgi:hypothetical protein